MFRFNALSTIFILLLIITVSHQGHPHRNRRQSSKTYHSIPSSINCTAHSYDDCPLEVGCQQELTRRNGKLYRKVCVFLDKAAPTLKHNHRS